MALKIKQNGKVKDLIIPACGVQILDMENNFESSNLEEVLQELGEGESIYVSDEEPDKDGIWISSDNTTTVSENPTLLALKNYIDEKLGTSELITEDKTIKGAINEHETQLKDWANPDMLINGDFRNPVNQRNITNIPAETVSVDRRYHYFIDRWFYQYLGLKATIVVDDNGVLITSTGTDGSDNPRIGIGQPLEVPYRVFAGQDVTLSFDIETNSKISIWLGGHDTTYTEIIGKNFQGSDSNILKERISITGKAISEFPDKLLRASIVLYGRGYLRIKNAKLELGSKPTPFIPRPYGEELALCQRYYRIIDCTMNTGGKNASQFSNELNRVIFDIDLGTPMRILPTFTATNSDSYGMRFVSANGINQDMDNTIIMLSLNKACYVNNLLFAMSLSTPTVTPVSGWVDCFIIKLDAEIY